MIIQRPAPGIPFTRGLLVGSLLFLCRSCCLLCHVWAGAGVAGHEPAGPGGGPVCGGAGRGVGLYYAATSTNGLQRSSISTGNNAPGF
ncbi:MAG: hypothetical protein HZY76_03055 [Anaerolineae bacterium]|nr:MAG: hypothetical protein HZY76_03055 [Anaerolineae bacterium]